MKGPKDYNGPLLIDPRDPKGAVLKLTSDQIKILKSTTSLLTNVFSKAFAKDQVTQRELATFIQLLALIDYNHQNVNILYRYYRFWCMSKAGNLISNRGVYKNSENKTSVGKKVPLVGMDNWHSVICYLDSLLVSLFYSSDSFDFLLDSTEFYNNENENIADELKQNIKELKIMLRFIVNLLRSGEYIPVQIMKQLCILFNDLGCDLTLSNRQEDALQFFEFFAECLSLPLLTIKLDIIHSGKMNLNDDLRLVEERALLISIPTSKNYSSETIEEEHEKPSESSPTPPTSDVEKAEEPIHLEECLNSYFNNSITVKRHLDRRRTTTINTLDGMKGLAPLSTLETPMESKAHDYFGESHNEDSPPDEFKQYLEYERLGILSPSIPSVPETPNSNTNNLFTSVSPTHQVNNHSSSRLSMSPQLPPNSPSSTANLTIRSGGEGSLYEHIDGFKVKSNHIENLTPTDQQSSSLIDSNSSVIAEDIDEELSPVIKDNEEGIEEDAFSAKMSPVKPSISKVSGLSEVSRTRSSTIVSVLNNVAANTSNSFKLSKRTSSFSGNEVTLPAWMFLQLLPYYADPNIKFKPENHEQYYRNKYIRSNTIEGDLPVVPKNSKFDQRYSDKRPIVPICLKRYLWDNNGQSHKIRRKIIIPQIIKYPYFIAEDKNHTKPGLVNFERTTENIAPYGSFMLVLESCICHRGNNVHSGHYISVTRKIPFSMNTNKGKNRSSNDTGSSSDTDTESLNTSVEDGSTDSVKWIVFNDLEPKGSKTKEMTFEEAMEQEDPYILFYRIVNIDANENFKINEEDELSFSEDGSTLKVPKVVVPVKVHGSNDKYWSESDSSAPNSTLLEARKGSIISQISSMSLKSQAQNAPQTIVPPPNSESDSIPIPKVLPQTNGSEVVPQVPVINLEVADAKLNSSKSSGLKHKHFYFMSSRSSSKLRKDADETPNTGDQGTQNLSAHNSITSTGVSNHHSHHHHLSLFHDSAVKPNDISPLDPAYLDVKDKYFWCDVSKDGRFIGCKGSNEELISLDGVDGGILEKFNSKISGISGISGLSVGGFKRNSIAQSLSFGANKDKDKDKDKEKEKEREKEKEKEKPMLVSNTTSTTTIPVILQYSEGSSTPTASFPEGNSNEAPALLGLGVSTKPAESSDKTVEDTPKLQSKTSLTQEKQANHTIDAKKEHNGTSMNRIKNGLLDVKSNSSSIRSTSKSNSNSLKSSIGGGKDEKKKEKKEGKLKKFFKNL